MSGHICGSCAAAQSVPTTPAGTIDVTTFADPERVYIPDPDETQSVDVDALLGEEDDDNTDDGPTKIN